MRARCPSDQSAGGVESRAGTARRGSAPVIAPASSRAVARTGRSVGTTHARTCERSIDRACPIESSWSRDHEDGGPTIQLPAAEFRCTLRFRTAISISRRVLMVCQSSGSASMGLVLLAVAVAALVRARRNVARLTTRHEALERELGTRCADGVERLSVSLGPRTMTS